MSIYESPYKAMHNSPYKYSAYAGLGTGA